MSDLKDFLEKMALFNEGRTFASFILKHGHEYHIDDKTFIGGKQGMCYKNSVLTIQRKPHLIYVEGYIALCGVPIEHAWTVTYDGVVRDYTLNPNRHNYDEDVTEYFGVPFNHHFVNQWTLKKGSYQLLDWTHPDILEVNPEEMIYARANSKHSAAVSKSDNNPGRRAKSRARMVG